MEGRELGCFLNGDHGTRTGCGGEVAGSGSGWVSSVGFRGGFRGRVEVRAIELDVGLDSDGSSWEQDMG